MKRGLIGYSGFVGSNLARQARFDQFYNSKNIGEIRGQHFAELFCAGVPALKWWANKYPDQDWLNIRKLLINLEQVTADRFVLISTVDVYSDPVCVDEASSINSEELEPYGKSRRRVEEFVQSRFPVFNIIRLPGLFGKGLKKNAIYDFIHLNEIEKIHSDSKYQFYNLESIAKDIRIAIENDLQIINFATEPVRVHEICAYVFDSKFESKPNIRPAAYDMRTRYAHLYDSEEPYMVWKNQTLSEIKHFMEVERRKLGNEIGRL